jgi:chromosome segregation ATPase
MTFAVLTAVEQRKGTVLPMRNQLMSKGSLVFAGAAEFLTLLTDPRWGAVMALSGGAIVGFVGLGINQWQRIVRARIENERLFNEARIANIKYEDQALEGTATRQIAKLTAMLEEQKESLLKARESLHVLRDENDAKEKARYAEVLGLQKQLAIAQRQIESAQRMVEESTDEIQQLREANSRLVRQVATLGGQVDHNTQVVAEAGKVMGEVGEQVRANSDAIAKSQADVAKTGEESK